MWKKSSVYVNFSDLTFDVIIITIIIIKFLGQSCVPGHGSPVKTPFIQPSSGTSDFKTYYYIIYNPMICRLEGRIFYA